jgi:hypothetical protein
MFRELVIWAGCSRTVNAWGEHREFRMNEEEWLTSNEPTPMLEYLRGKERDRKLRLYAVACCRRIWNLLQDERSRKAVLVAEAFAEGMAGREHLVAARDEAREVKKMLAWPAPAPARRAAYAAFDTTRDTGNSAANNAPYEAAGALNLEDENRCEQGELRQQANLLRCIFGNPFRPVTLDPAWLTPSVIELAQRIYAERAFDQMPTLADALEDTGCDDSDILNHCGGPGAHFRGCWVVDAILGKP